MPSSLWITPHRPSGPQCKWQLDLVRAFVGDPSLRATRLRARQNTASLPRRDTAAIQPSRRTTDAVALQPADHHLPMHPPRSPTTIASPDRRLVLGLSIMRHEINRTLP